VSLALDALVLVGGVALARWIAGVVRRARRGPVNAAAARPSAPNDPFAPFPCHLGDVVLRTTERQEAWLAAALLFEEERPVGVLFVAPEAGGDRAVFVRDAAGGQLLWLAPIAPGELSLPREPPHAIEHRGDRFERVRRTPVRVVRAGRDAPAVGDRAILAEYAGPAPAKIVLVAGDAQTLAWRGEALGPGEYDVLPGGEATLRE